MTKPGVLSRAGFFAFAERSLVSELPLPCAKANPVEALEGPELEIGTTIPADHPSHVSAPGTFKRAVSKALQISGPARQIHPGQGEPGCMSRSQPREVRTGAVPLWYEQYEQKPK
jgi:hypothetical protein